MMISRLFRIGYEGKRLWILTFITYCALCSVMIVSVIGLGGCQIDLGANLGTKMFYPDNAGDKKIGDPRKGSSEERSVSTSVEYKPFPGVAKGGE